MGLFDKIFRNKASNNQKQGKTTKKQVLLEKGETFIFVDNNSGYKMIRLLTDHQKDSIEKSTLRLHTGQLYMHYWTDNLVCENPMDQSWQNKVIFFWKAEEQFPKKSLPPEFESFKTKHFLFEENTTNVSLKIGQAMPWFGMPGLGEKHVCEMNAKQIAIPELNKLGIITYFEQIQLTDDNLNILTDKRDYFFLIDNRITPFRNGSFHLKDKPIPISTAYSIGGIHIIKKV